MSIFDAVIDTTNQAIANNQLDYNQDIFETVYSHGLHKTRIKDGIDGKPSLQSWQQASGLDYDIIPMNETWEYNNVVHTSPDKILIRSDTGEKLSNVSGKYQIVQPSTVVQFFADLVDHYGWDIKTMGYCDGGRKVFAFAQTDGTTWDATGKGDQMLNHLLITTSCDGSIATMAQPFIERLVCFNQLPYMQSLFKPVKIRHSSVFDPKQVKFNLGIYTDSGYTMIEKIKQMTRKRVTNQEAVSAIYAVMADADKPVELQSTRRLNQVMDVYSRFRGAGMGSNQEGVQGTMWGVLNAITEWTDHAQGNNENNRFRNAHYGTGFNLKNDAFEILDMYTREEADIPLLKEAIA